MITRRSYTGAIRSIIQEVKLQTRLSLELFYTANFDLVSNSSESRANFAALCIVGRDNADFSLALNLPLEILHVQSTDSSAH